MRRLHSLRIFAVTLLGILFIVEAHATAFVKLTCKGITTPGGGVDAVVYTDLLTVFFPVNTAVKFPSLFDLRNSNPTRFEFITKECNRRRYASTTFPSGRPAIWPDWGNDRKYQRIDIGEVNLSRLLRNRTIGTACEISSQCASRNCDLNTNSCQGGAGLEVDVL